MRVLGRALDGAVECQSVKAPEELGVERDLLLGMKMGKERRLRLLSPYQKKKITP